MKISTLLAVLVLSAGLCDATDSLAADDVPNLVGTWKTECHGELIQHTKDGPQGNQHREPGFSTISGEAIVTSQEGRIFRGKFRSPKFTSNIVGIIHSNGADPQFPHRISFMNDYNNGHHEGFLIGGRIYYMYRHSSATDTSIALCVSMK